MKQKLWHEDWVKQQIQVPALTSGHEQWVVTETMRMKTSFLQKGLDEELLHMLSIGGALFSSGGSFDASFQWKEGRRRRFGNPENVWLLNGSGSHLCLFKLAFNTVAITFVCEVQGSRVQNISWIQRPEQFS